MLKLKVKTLERRHVFIANFEHISHLFLARFSCYKTTNKPIMLPPIFLVKIRNFRKICTALQNNSN